MKTTIEKHGGCVLQEHECFTFQLIHMSEVQDKRYQRQEYYPGFIYNFRWVLESIEKGKLLKNTDF